VTAILFYSILFMLPTRNHWFYYIICYISRWQDDYVSFLFFLFSRHVVTALHMTSSIVCLQLDV